MLVLTRRVGEKLVIGNEVIVEIISISGEGVRVGITAPRETSVHRFEVFDEILAANRAASASSASDQRASLEDFAARLRKGKQDGDQEGGGGSD
jgi:carbon storage regulator